MHGCIFFSVRKRDKVSKEIIESLGHAITLFDYRLNGLSLLAKDMIHSNCKIKDEGVFRLLEVCYNKEQVLEIVFWLAVNIMSNYTSHIA